MTFPARTSSRPAPHINSAHAPFVATLHANPAATQPWEDDRRFTVELTHHGRVLSRRHTDDLDQARTFLAWMPEHAADQHARRLVHAAA